MPHRRGSGTHRKQREELYAMRDIAAYAPNDSQDRRMKERKAFILRFFVLIFYFACKKKPDTTTY